MSKACNLYFKFAGFYCIIVIIKNLMKKVVIAVLVALLIILPLTSVIALKEALLFGALGVVAGGLGEYLVKKFRK